VCVVVPVSVESSELPEPVPEVQLPLGSGCKGSMPSSELVELLSSELAPSSSSPARGVKGLWKGNLLLEVVGERGSVISSSEGSSSLPKLPGG
jgi:hypothetical protein